jgi:hypothetical protein
MATSLRSQLDALAAKFAQQIVSAIQAASLNELTPSRGAAGGAMANGRSIGRATAKPVGSARSTLKPSGRLARRSDEEIQAAVRKIVLLVKTHKEGMRAEEIRAALGMLPKEMPRILKEGVRTKKLTSKGQKRATTYFAR